MSPENSLDILCKPNVPCKIRRCPMQIQGMSPANYFWQKMTKSKKNFVMGKSFDYAIFVLKYVSKHSESIPTQKKFSTKIFRLCHFFTILAKKRLSQRKNIVCGKNFRFRDFRFKTRFKIFWIDSDQKTFFDQNFLTEPFFTIFGQKMTKSMKKFCNGKNFSLSRFSF